MPTYIQKVTDSDIQPSGNVFSKVISTGTGTDTSVNVPINKGVTAYGYFFTPAGVPSNDDWEDAGGEYIYIEIDTGDVNFICRVRVARYNSSGVFQEAGDWTNTQTLDVSRGYTIITPTWGTCACGDRYCIEVEILNDSHSNSSIDIGVGTSSDYVTSSISEDAAGCEVSAVPNACMMMGVGI